MSLGIELAEKGYLPDFLIRVGIRNLLQKRLEKEKSRPEIEKEKILENLKRGPIAEKTDAANEQHYEVPTEFYEIVLGKYLKYSSGFYQHKSDSLSDAELNMLNLYFERAGIENGMKVLDLGCGWGSVSLALAEKFPEVDITSVSNSSTQRKFIESKAKERGFDNIKVITCDINELEFDVLFDRIISVEMFEHMRNYDLLLRKVAKFLMPEGKAFVHIFTHKDLTYFFEEESKQDWLTKYFFSGGIMPSQKLLHEFKNILKIEKEWTVSGVHYQRTAMHWYENLLANKARVMEIFRDCYGAQEAEIWFNRWKIFFLSCAELWGFHHGQEWQVTHYLLKKA